MTDEQYETRLEPAGEPEADKAAKPAWEKPVIRASGTFEMQALACAPSQQREGFPPCLGGTS